MSHLLEILEIFLNLNSGYTGIRPVIPWIQNAPCLLLKFILRFNYYYLLNTSIMYFLTQHFNYVLICSTFKLCTTLINTSIMYFLNQQFNHVLPYSTLQSCTSLLNTSIMYYLTQHFNYVLPYSTLQLCTYLLNI